MFSDNLAADRSLFPLIGLGRPFRSRTALPRGSAKLPAVQITPELARND